MMVRMLFIIASSLLCLQSKAQFNNILLYQKQTVTVDADAQAFITATGITEQTQINAITNLVTGMKSAGLWDKMIAIYPFVGGTSSSHAVNLKTPGTYNITWSGTVTHNSNGVTGDGSTGYGNTGVVPATTLAEGSAHMSFYNRNTPARSQQEMGVLMGGTPQPSFVLMASYYASNTYYTVIDCWAWNASPQQRVLVTGQRTGMTIGTRTSTSMLKLFKNNAQIGSSFTGTTSGYFSQITRPIAILARNDNGTINQYSTANCAFVTVGAGLSDSEVTAFYDLVQAFQTALGRAV